MMPSELAVHAANEALLMPRAEAVTYLQDLMITAAAALRLMDRPDGAAQHTLAVHAALLMQGAK